jgi:thiol-disulfide isomerase/thioredoxin/sugar lactone lactonase YvrE
MDSGIGGLCGGFDRMADRRSRRTTSCQLWLKVVCGSLLMLLVLGASGCGDARPQQARGQDVAATKSTDDGSSAGTPQTAKPLGDSSDATSPESASKTEEPHGAEKADSPAKPVAARADDDEEMLDRIFAHRETRAPSLDGGVGWINAAGPVDLKDLRGKFVLLDFWCFCCINCMHVLPELKQLEQAYPNDLVVIGVHSAKFEAEQDSKNIKEAVLRYGIEHPVVNDANQTIWNRYGVESWPTLVLIDPDGYLLFARGGEVKASLFDSAILKKVIPYYRKKGLLDERPLHFDLERYRATQSPLRFPGKIAADEAGDRLFISDSNHNRIVVARLNGELLDVIGSGEVGKADGDYKTAQFNRPQGMALADETLYVSDTENHLLRKIDLKRRQVTTIAGTGVQAENGWPGWTQIAGLPFDIGGDTKPQRFVGPPPKTALSSPWDLVIARGLSPSTPRSSRENHQAEDAEKKGTVPLAPPKDLFIAMAGTHQIWKMPLDESEIGPYAGNSREDIVDGTLLPPQPYLQSFASFAQPSGLATDGKRLFVADSEGSSIREVPLGEGEVGTIVGTADLPHSRLFTFGDVDGEGKKVRLQHPLGVAFHNGVVYVADTYNNKIKAIDPTKRTSKTLAGSGNAGRDDSTSATAATFDEPTGLCYAAGKLFVADTNNHLIRTIDLEHDNQVATLKIRGLAPPEPPKTAAANKPSYKDAEQVKLPEAKMKPADGAIRLAVKIKLPAGYKINPLAQMRYYLESESPTGPIDRAALGKLTPLDHPSAEFEIKLPVKETTGGETIKLSMNYYYCQSSDSGVCKIGSVTWAIPVVLSSNASSSSTPVALVVEK